MEHDLIEQKQEIKPEVKTGQLVIKRVCVTRPHDLCVGTCKKHFYITAVNFLKKPQQEVLLK